MLALARENPLVTRAWSIARLAGRFLALLRSSLVPLTAFSQVPFQNAAAVLAHLVYQVVLSLVLTRNAGISRQRIPAVYLALQALLELRQYSHAQERENYQVYCQNAPDPTDAPYQSCLLV
jgi:hypothetical protein